MISLTERGQPAGQCLRVDKDGRTAGFGPQRSGMGERVREGDLDLDHFCQVGFDGGCRWPNSLLDLPRHRV